MHSTAGVQPAMVFTENIDLACNRWKKGVDFFLKLSNIPVSFLFLVLMKLPLTGTLVCYHMYSTQIHGISTNQRAQSPGHTIRFISKSSLKTGIVGNNKVLFESKRTAAIPYSNGQGVWTHFQASQLFLKCIFLLCQSSESKLVLQQSPFQKKSINMKLSPLQNMTELGYPYT